MLKWLVILIAVLATPLQAQEVLHISPRDTLNTVPPPPLQIYMIVNGEQVGPLDAGQFKTYLAKPEAAASTYVWMPGMPEWLLASNVPQLQAIIASIGHVDGEDTGAFTVADINAFILGVWISQRFTWKLKDGPHSVIIQMKVLPNGQFEGVTIMWRKEAETPIMRVYREQGSLDRQQDRGRELQVRPPHILHHRRRRRSRRQRPV